MLDQIENTIESSAESIWILDYYILGNNIIDYLTFIIIFFVLFFWMKYLFVFLINKQKKSRKKNTIIQSLINVPKYIYILIEFSIAIKFLNLWDLIWKVVNWLLIFWVIVVILHTLNAFVIKVIYPLIKDNKKSKNDNDTIKNAIKNIVFIVVWVVWILFFLDNIGVEITPLLASLWVASIAIAFALQNILSDLFSSFSILLTPYYKIWDFVELDSGQYGTIIDITMKNTILLSPHWEHVIIPNSKMTSSNVKNYGSMKDRRTDITIGVVYWTSTQKLKKAITIIKTAVNSIEDCNCDRVNLVWLGSYSIDIKFRFFISNWDYLAFLDKQEKILFKIIEWFEKEKIEFAFPTQTILTQNIK